MDNRAIRRDELPDLIVDAHLAIGPHAAVRLGADRQDVALQALIAEVQWGDPARDRGSVSPVVHGPVAEDDPPAQP